MGKRWSVRPLAGSAMIEPPATMTGPFCAMASSASRDSARPRPVQTTTSMPAWRARAIASATAGRTLLEGSSTVPSRSSASMS